MFVFSIKAGKKERLAAVFCAVAVVLIAVGALFLPSSSRPTAARPQMNVSAETEEQRLQLLKSLGCETDGELPEVREVRIPDEADEVFSDYNALQKQCGMDLEPCMGKRVKVYTYHVLNSAESGAAKANLYVYKGKAVAGDLTAVGAAEQPQPLFPLL